MKSTIKSYFNIKKLILVIIGAFLYSVAVIYFYMSGDLYTGGLTGLILIVEELTNDAFSFSLLLILFNIPLVTLGWFKLGRRLVFYTLIAIIASSIFTAVLPALNFVISDEPLLMALYGGIINGVGVALVLKAGGSSGGTDIIALYLSELSGKQVGTYAMLLNFVVLILTAILFKLEVALFSIIATYVSSVMVNRIHTRYEKLTVTVNMPHVEEFLVEFHENYYHGITVLDAVGAYTKTPRKLLYIIITSYELQPFIELVRKYDENAFVNVTKSEEVFGNFVVPKIDDI